MEAALQPQATFTKAAKQLYRMSPSARLLRQSKLFSLPQNLARSESDEQDATYRAESNTATLPHPISQAIATTPQGLDRGDWGLKRPLPLKSTTKTSTPVIRINGIDSADDVTDFSSAADHYLTMRKWHEMQIPMVLPYKKEITRISAPVSAFESKNQATAKYDEEGNATTGRWRFTGPYLVGLTPGQFETYIETTIKKKGPRLHAFAKQWLTKRRAAQAQSKALEDGTLGETQVESLTDEEVTRELSDMRRDTIKTTLISLIWDFLDLPGRPIHESLPKGNAQAVGLTDFVDGGYASPVAAPPTTHPSAGLSYLRTNNILHNHPILGPMRSPPPVQARILKYKGPGKSQSQLQVGVGGVVANIDHIELGSGRGSSNERATFQPDLKNGGKIWVQPKSASVDTKGRIQLSVKKADPDAPSVWEHEEPPAVSVSEGLFSLQPTTLPKFTLETRRARNGISSMSRQSRRSKPSFDEFMDRAPPKAP